MKYALALMVWFVRHGLRLWWLEWVIAFKSDSVTEVRTLADQCRLIGDWHGVRHYCEAAADLHIEIQAALAECRRLKSSRP